MPFAADGTYTPPTGAENAAAGNVIRSATWNSIFTDISTALTQLGKGNFFATPRTAGAGSFTVAAADAVILVTASAPTITFPLAATKTCPVKIFGAAAGIFGTSKSVVLFSGGETVSGLTSFTLGVNYQAVAFYPVTGGYILG